MAMKIQVSFKKKEKTIYDFANKKKSPSAYIKELIEEDMSKNRPEKKVNVWNF
ncbi:MAG: hypothetical protein N2376_00360 [Clostridia bacterium]|nr:hypothetical protein [Clostridia bacterium]